MQSLLLSCKPLNLQTLNTPSKGSLRASVDMLEASTATLASWRIAQGVVTIGDDGGMTISAKPQGVRLGNMLKRGTY